MTWFHCVSAICLALMYFCVVVSYRSVHVIKLSRYFYIYISLHMYIYTMREIHIYVIIIIFHAIFVWQVDISFTKLKRGLSVFWYHFFIFLLSYVALYTKWFFAERKSWLKYFDIPCWNMMVYFFIPGFKKIFFCYIPRFLDRQKRKVNAIGK